MNGIKFKSGLVTITRSELEKIRKQEYEAAMNELLRREQDILREVGDNSLKLVLLTGYKALSDMECDYDFAVEFGNRVADTLTLINNDKMTLEDIEKEIDEVYGIKLVKEEQ